MNKIPFTPPPQLSPLSKEKIRKLKTHKLSEEKKAYIDEKYMKPVLERERKLKKKKCSYWWHNNLFNVIATIGTAIGIIIGLIELLSK